MLTSRAVHLQVMAFLLMLVSVAQLVNETTQHPDDPPSTWIAYFVYIATFVSYPFSHFPLSFSHFFFLFFSFQLFLLVTAFLFVCLFSFPSSFSPPTVPPRVAPSSPSSSPPPPSLPYSPPLRRPVLYVSSCFRCSSCF